MKYQECSSTPLYHSLNNSMAELCPDHRLTVLKALQDLWDSSAEVNWLLRDYTNAFVFHETELGDRFWANCHGSNAMMKEGPYDKWLSREPVRTYGNRHFTPLYKSVKKCYTDPSDWATARTGLGVMWNTMISEVNWEATTIEVAFTNPMCLNYWNSLPLDKK